MSVINYEMIQAIFYDNNLDYEHKNEEKNTRKCF